jgi:hypothetical protein
MRGTEWSSCVVCLRSFKVGDGASLGVESDSERVFKTDFIGVQTADADDSRSCLVARVGDCARGGESGLEKVSRIIASSFDARFIVVGKQTDTSLL